MRTRDFLLMADRVRVMTARVRDAEAAVRRELTGRRFVASSVGLVEAEADPVGQVVDIRFARSALTRTRGGELATQVVAAVRGARESMRAEHLRLVRAHLAGAAR